jgi:hypothetical protein
VKSAETLDFLNSSPVKRKKNSLCKVYRNILENTEKNQQNQIVFATGLTHTYLFLLKRGQMKLNFLATELPFKLT